MKTLDLVAAVYDRRNVWPKKMAGVGAWLSAVIDRRCKG